MTAFDLVISGGSLIGLSLAKALSELPIKIAVIEPRALTSDHTSSENPNNNRQESRAIALSFGSRIFFSELGLWNKLAPHSNPIAHIHCSEKGRCGNTHLDAKKEGLQALGYVIPFAAFQKELYQAVNTQDNLTFFSLLSLQKINLPQEAHLPIELHIACAEHMQKLTTQCLIGADGAHSFIRQSLGMKFTKKDYRQAAIIADIQPSVPHKNRAYERFTKNGPMALLPLKNGLCALVYSVPIDTLQQTLALNNADFLAAVQERFGYRLGHFKWVSTRQGFPLHMTIANELTRSRTLLIGNAAHTLHPIAGQGFNLGLRDIATLTTLFRQAHETGLDIGATHLLQQYVTLRQQDHRLTRHFTDALIDLFDHNFLPLAHGRNVAMNAINLFPPLKSLLTRQATGLSQRRSIQSGLPLS